LKMTIGEIAWLIFVVLLVVIPLGSILALTFQVASGVLGPAPQYQRTGQKPPELATGLMTGLGALVGLLLVMRTHLVSTGAWAGFGLASLGVVAMYVALILGASIYGSLQAQPGDPTERRGNLSTVLNIIASVLPGALLVFAGGSIAGALVGSGVFGGGGDGSGLPFFGMLMLPVVIGIPLIVGVMGIAMFSKSATAPGVPIGITLGLGTGVLLPFLLGALGGERN
jgi:hypothetical protein